MYSPQSTMLEIPQAYLTEKHLSSSSIGISQSTATLWFLCREMPPFGENAGCPTLPKVWLTRAMKDIIHTPFQGGPTRASYQRLQTTSELQKKSKHPRDVMSSLVFCFFCVSLYLLVVISTFRVTSKKCTKKTSGSISDLEIYRSKTPPFGSQGRATWWRLVGKPAWKASEKFKHHRKQSSKRHCSKGRNMTRFR